MLKQFQKKLRSEKTNPEYLLWSFLRNRRLAGYKFRRQQILNGFIVDFVCLEKMLVVEVDGEHHADQIAQDEARTKKLHQYGFQVLRYWNKDILNDVSLVLNSILDALEKR